MIFLGHLTAFVCKFTTKVMNLCCEVVKLLKKFVRRQRLKRKQEGGDNIENETNAPYDIVRKSEELGVVNLKLQFSLNGDI